MSDAKGTETTPVTCDVTGMSGATLPVRRRRHTQWRNLNTTDETHVETKCSWLHEDPFLRSLGVVDDECHSEDDLSVAILNPLESIPFLSRSDTESALDRIVLKLQMN